MEILNRNSYVFLSTLIWLLVAFFLLRSRTTIPRLLFLLGLALLLATINLALHRETTPLRTRAEFDQMLQSGRPTLVEFYSDY